MKTLPKLEIAHLPTPVEELPRLSAALGGPRLLVKRDDQTGLAFGGNKTRKLEFLLGDAREKGAQSLITAGAIQSNHCRQTAAAAAREGFACLLVLTGQPPDEPEANTYLDLLLGAQLLWTTKDQRDQTLVAEFQKLKEKGGEPYLIPYGGSNPIGAAAYAYAMQELQSQGVEPDWIVFATSSGGTQAGMIVGADLFGVKAKILGISVDEPAPIITARVAELATQTAELLGYVKKFTTNEVLVNDDYLGAGYAVMGPPERQAIRHFASHEALLVDPVYTGRAAAGLIDLIRKGFFKQGETVLFWHTGGHPALFAEQYREEILGAP